MESIVCSHCGGANSAENLFCQTCGQRLEGVLPLDSLGVHRDGWSDVYEDAAPLAEKVRNEFLNLMKANDIEGLRVLETNLVSERKEARKCLLIDQGKGTALSVSVTPFGKGLAVSRDLYIKRSINWLVVGILAGTVVLLALIEALVDGAFSSSFLRGLFSLITTILAWALTPALAVMLAGKLLRDDWLTFFVRSPDEFAIQDAESLTTIVDDALTQAVERTLGASVK